MAAKPPFFPSNPLNTANASVVELVETCDNLQCTHFDL
jgi:hypothetical protein